MKTLDNLNAISGGAHTGEILLREALDISPFVAIVVTLMGLNINGQVLAVVSGFSAAAYLSRKSSQYSNYLDTRDAMSAARA